jgi:hypothetical protein
MADFQDLERRGTARLHRQRLAGGLGLAVAATAVVALVVAQPWADRTNSAPQPVDAPDSTQTSDSSSLAIVGDQTYADGDVVTDEIELCKVGSDCAREDGVVTATVRMTVSGEGWTAYTEDEVSSLAKGDDEEANWAAVSWTPIRGWVTADACAPGHVESEKIVSTIDVGSTKVPGLTFGAWTDTTFAGRPARQTTVELSDLCTSVDAWILASAGTSESLSRVRIADGPGPRTFTIVPIPEAGPDAQLAFYDFNGDDHKRTRAQLRERDEILQSLSITVE